MKLEHDLRMLRFLNRQDAENCTVQLLPVLKDHVQDSY